MDYEIASSLYLNFVVISYNLEIIISIYFDSDGLHIVNFKMMYSEWASLTTQIQNGSEENVSVLGKLPSAVGKEVAITVVKNLVSNLGLTSQPAEPSSLASDKEVQWCMEVID